MHEDNYRTTRQAHPQQITLPGATRRKTRIMKSSNELLHGMKRESWWLWGALFLAVLCEWLGFTRIAGLKDGLLLELCGAVLILRLWLIECTEIIIAAIKEEG
jgi:hypothetical protein